MMTSFAAMRRFTSSVSVSSLARGKITWNQPTSSVIVRCPKRYFGTADAAPALTLGLTPRTLIVVELHDDRAGQLAKLSALFDKHHVSMTHIESKLKTYTMSGPSLHIDFEGAKEEPRVAELLKEIKETFESVRVMPPREIPWFPLNIRDLDLTKDTLDAGTQLISDDHPGFLDDKYRNRRTEIVTIANEYKHGMEIPRINYTDEEVNTWGIVYKKLQAKAKQYSCKEYHKLIAQMEHHCGYAPDNIPQLNDISNFLQQTTGFSLRPVTGLLSARDFLNALAFRVFFSTQYIRHHGNPFYTPEPDICHELMGHAPLFADPSFADFSHKIGLASLAASDRDIDMLATCYWFTVEFGLLQEEGQVKAYGAGLLSSFGEMEWACADEPSDKCREMGGVATSYPDLMKPELKPFEPLEVALQKFPITTYQPVYFVAEDLKDVQTKMDAFCDTLAQPFFPQYNPLTQSVVVSKSIARMDRSTTAELQAQKQREFFDELHAHAGPTRQKKHAEKLKQHEQQQQY